MEGGKGLNAVIDFFSAKVQYIHHVSVYLENTVRIKVNTTNGLMRIVQILCDIYITDYNSL